MPNRLRRMPGRRAHGAYPTVIGVLTISLLAVIWQSYHSSRRYERKMAALQKWQRDSIDAANALARKTAGVEMMLTTDGPDPYPLEDEDKGFPPAPVRAARHAMPLLDELGRYARLEEGRVSDARYLKFLERRLSRHEAGTPTEWRERADREAKATASKPVPRRTISSARRDLKRAGAARVQPE